MRRVISANRISPAAKFEHRKKAKRDDAAEMSTRSGSGAKSFNYMVGSQF